MSNTNCNLDLRKDNNYDIIFQSNRTLQQGFLATDIDENGVEIPFDFTQYDGAILYVKIKPEFDATILQFNTSDSSIVLAAGGSFSLVKTSDQMDVNNGTYFYDMYLTSGTVKREFMHGKFTLTDDVTP